MHFKDSCVTHLVPYGCTEESTALPAGIFPVYIGSGNTVMSVDASGLQSLNHGVERAFGAMPGSGDMYVVSHGMLSDHIDRMNVLPYGFLTWEAQLDGMTVDGGSLKDLASVWRRTLDLREGRVVTEMLLGLSARISIGLSMPLGHDCILITVRVKGYDYSNRPITAPKTGEMEIRLDLRTRAGKPVYDRAEQTEDTLRVSVAGHEEYTYGVTFTGDGPEKAEFRDGRFGIRFRIDAADAPCERKFLIDFSEGLTVSDADALTSENRARRAEKFGKRASIEGLEPDEEFIYNNTHHLLMSCFNYDKGLPIGMPFFFPWCWRCSTFWDSHFVMDGMMRSGAREEADAFIRYLHAKKNASGKPYPWMFAYDGTPTVENDRDIAPLVMCAHAMTAIKHYEYYKDPEYLKKYDYEICRDVSIFAARNLFGKDEAGRWILSMPVSGDVVEDAPHEVNQTFTALWFLVIFRKTLEMQEILGIEKDGLLEEITAGYYLEHTGEEYLASRGVGAGESGASWVPFLLYPTEGMPFVDMDLIDRTREKHNFPDLYMKFQGSYQPWTEFIQASSDFRRGAVEEGYRMRRIGLSHAFGPGLFSEIGPKQQTVGLPPYISAHGSFLTALITQFVTADIWDGPIGIFTHMPEAYRGRPVTVHNVICQNGFAVSAKHDAHSVSAHLTSASASDIEVRVAGPDAADGREPVISIENDGGQVCGKTYDPASGVLTVRFTAVKNAIITMNKG